MEGGSVRREEGREGGKIFRQANDVFSLPDFSFYSLPPSLPPSRPPLDP